ncbi:MAG: WXG100 family type VII secretion target [Nocardioides sp.]
MSTYTVNPAAAETVRETLKSVTDRIKSELESLDQVANSSLSEWEGSAKDQYAVARAEWFKTAERMPSHLQGINLALGNIVERYGNTEHGGVKYWNGFSAK